MPIGSFGGAAAGTALLLAAAGTANAACTPITTAAELQAIENNLSGRYCLENDIDLSSIANFVPIGQSDSFSGTLNGRNHVIRNLTVTSNVGSIGLFSDIGDGTIWDLRLVNAKIKSTGANASAGVLAGTMIGTFKNIHVDGKVTCTKECTAGGIAAFADGLEQSSSAASVTLLASGGRAGGALGNAIGTVQTSFATGRVTCGDDAFCGGFIGGAVVATVLRSYATGTVVCGANSFCGGFLASAASNTFNDIYATGSVSGGASSFIGGLFGSIAVNTISNAFAAGAVTGDVIVGGFAGSSAANTITNVYWDTDTSGTTAGGDNTAVGLTTAQLRAALPAGFSPTLWGITPDLSYPSLKAVTFRSTLATLVVGTDLYTFLPLSQFDTSNYLGATDHIDAASLAASFTMIARAIGETQDIGKFQRVAIDRYFWDDASQTALWNGGMRHFAKRGPLTDIADASSLRNNVVAALENGKLVLLRGEYQNNGQTTETWMLATLFTEDADGRPTAVYAHDPFTGGQVRINPITKTVVYPAPFPLDQFKVTGYRAVTILP